MRRIAFFNRTGTMSAPPCCIPHSVLSSCLGCRRVPEAFLIPKERALCLVVSNRHDNVQVSLEWGHVSHTLRHKTLHKTLIKYTGLTRHFSWGWIQKMISEDGLNRQRRLTWRCSWGLVSSRTEMSPKVWKVCRKYSSNNSAIPLHTRPACQTS
jgi:hypothetical protein